MIWYKWTAPDAARHCRLYQLGPEIFAFNWTGPVLAIGRSIT
jgi:hypothetical protein